MRNLSWIRCLCFLGAWLFSLGVCVGQTVDTTVYHKLSGVEVVEKVRPSVTRETTPLQIMDRASIDRLGVQDLSEAVKRFSGVTVQDYGGIGGLKTVSVRSLGAKHTAVSYDGVTVTDAQSGQVDISRFALDNVESVSLSIGQSDDIFQTARAFASAGALNIQTSKPIFKDKSFNTWLKVKGGSFGLFNSVLHYDQQLSKRWSASLHGDFVRADGRYPYTFINGELKTKRKRRNTDTKSYHLEGNLYGELGKGGEIKIKAYYYDSERGLPGSINFYAEKANERMWDNNFFVQSNYKKFFNEKLAFNAVVKYNYAFMRYLDVNDRYADGEQRDLNTQNEYYGSAGLLYKPFRFLSASLTTDLTHSKLNNNFADGPNPKRLSSQSVFAIQYKDRRFTVTGSLLGTFITEKVERGDKPEDKKRLSPAISLSWRPFSESSFRVRTSFKDIFRVPTFTDLYYLRMGNTNLRPEKTTQYNLGLTWSTACSSWLKHLNVSIDGYYNTVKDKIVAFPSMYIWRMQNMGEVDIKGVDVNLSTQFSLPLDMELFVSSTYSLQYAVDITDPDAKNYKDQIPYTPRHTGTATVSLKNPWVNISYILSAVGDRYSSAQNIIQNRIESYIEQNISFNKELKFSRCKVRLQGELLNLANVNYDVIKYYPMPGRSWRLSMIISY